MNKKYYAYLKQNDGCGHTIGCGCRLVSVDEKASSVAEACQLVVDKYLEDYRTGQPWSPEEVWLLEVSEEINLHEAFVAEKIRQDKIKEQKDKEDTIKLRRALYEELKREFELEL